MGALRRSATFDNDTAFARHGLLRQALELATFFWDAYIALSHVALHLDG